MDSGCTTPILDDSNLFKDLRESDARVQTADGTVAKIKYEGPAELVVVDRNDEEHTICLPRAFYCPDMHNLLSVKQLMRLDYDVTFSRKRGLRVETDGTVIPLHLHDNLYQVRYRRTPRKAFDT